MTDRLSKDPEPAQDEPARCYACGETHVDAVVGPRPGSRTWWWSKRTEHLALFVVPAVPLITAVQEFLAPRMMVRAEGSEGERLNGVYEYAPGVASHITNVVVELDAPTLLDRAVFALPSVVFALLLGFVSYALWRVEVNMTGHTRAYTEKDNRVLGRTNAYLVLGWLLVVAMESGASAWFKWQVGDGGGSFPQGVHHDATSLLVLAMCAMLTIMVRVYVRGRRAYEELESGV